MPCIGIACDVRKENVSFLECSVCDRCNKFPSILKKKFLFPSIRHIPPKISVTLLTECQRQAYLKLTENYYIGRKGIISTQIGSAIHEYVGPMSDIYEKFISWKTPAGNTCIGYLDAISISKRILYDIKTISHGWYIRDKGAKKRDMLQLQIYATILKQMYGVELAGMRLVYVGLGDKDCMEIEVPYEDKTEFINQRTDELQGYLDRKEIPKGNPIWDWECQYCPFAEKCPDKKTEKIDITAIGEE
ncbi:MAG: Dna2/Cas4 domain-containing protein [Candidatus Aenigmatarchaeota archaeon]